MTLLDESKNGFAENISFLAFMRGALRPAAKQNGIGRWDTT